MSKEALDQSMKDNAGLWKAIDQQARIHTGFRRFTEIGQISQNESGTQEVDFESPK